MISSDRNPADCPLTMAAAIAAAPPLRQPNRDAEPAFGVPGFVRMHGRGYRRADRIKTNVDPRSSGAFGFGPALTFGNF